MGNFLGRGKSETETKKEPVTNTQPLLNNTRNSKAQIDEEMGSAPASCRICLEPEEDLISPCKCKGTQQFVHRTCLDQWRSVKEGFAFTHCSTCKAQYHLIVPRFETNAWRKFRFRFFVARDVLLVFLALQAVIAALAGFVYLMDKNENLRNFIGDHWGSFFSANPITFYYCSGAMLFLALFGFFGLMSVCLECFDVYRRPGLNNYCNNQYCNGRNNCINPGYCSNYVYYNNRNNNRSDSDSRKDSSSGGEAILIFIVAIVVIFAILGIVVGFAVATAVMQRIWQRHYLILTKRELTEEFVVVDLQGCYTPPKLEPEHERRLKNLGLL